MHKIDPMHDPMYKVLDTLDTATLLDTIDEALTLYQSGPALSREFYGMLWAMACALVCLRLGLDPETVAGSPIDAATYLRMVAAEGEPDIISFLCNWCEAREHPFIPDENDDPWCKCGARLVDQRARLANEARPV